MNRSTFSKTSVIVLCLLLPGLPICSAAPERMTYSQAKARIPGRGPPGFWIGDVKDLPERFERLKRGQMTVAAVSPGGKPMHLITYGDKENVAHHANFNSAIGAREPATYVDKAARKRPVIFFIGPVHGHEVEGLTGLVNLIHVMETGEDLLGRKQEKLRQLGEQCRVLIVPAGNPDGTARFEPRMLHGMESMDLRFWGQGTWKDDTMCDWPACKRQHPMVGDNVGFLGCYFNNSGINPMHDEFFAPMGPEAPALLRIALEEGPDLVVSLHSHESRPVLLRPAYLPAEVQQDIQSLARECYTLMGKRDLPHDDPFKVSLESGKVPSSFNLTSALYHVSGAGSFTFECPHGLRGACQVTPEQILDIQLTLYEAMLHHEINKKS